MGRIHLVQIVSLITQSLRVLMNTLLRFAHRLFSSHRLISAQAGSRYPPQLAILLNPSLNSPGGPYEQQHRDFRCQDCARGVARDCASRSTRRGWSQRPVRARDSATDRCEGVVALTKSTCRHQCVSAAILRYDLHLFCAAGDSAEFHGIRTRALGSQKEPIPDFRGVASSRGYVL